ncbi:MAG: FtsX-like permease family protein [Anaerolineaceae bacterium]|nr:FtsX-like permease family protein [Anaerolineaceae bacterium]
MRLYLRLAWRNLWRHRRRTLIVILSMGLTLAMMMMYDGLIAGFEQAIYANAIKVLGGNIQVHANGYNDKTDMNPLLPLGNNQAAVQSALAQPQVVAASLRITTGGMVTNRKGAFGVSIVGIEPEKELPVSLLSQHVSSGRYLTSADKDVVFIGKGLADAMQVQVGDRITLAGKATHQQLRQQSMTVVGIYDVGMADIERGTVYIALGEAQDLYGLSGQATEVMVSLKQIGQEPAVISSLKTSLPGYEMDSWQTNYPDLQSALETKGAVMNVFSVIILFIAGIGILNLLLMAVYERTREIGLMGALGMRPGQISFLFILEGGLMGLVGVAFGVTLGLLCNILLRQVGLDFGAYTTVTQYMALITGRVYPTLGTEKIVMRSLTVLIIAVLASFYPAHEAAQSEPAAALHYV